MNREELGFCPAPCTYQGWWKNFRLGTFKLSVKLSVKMAVQEPFFQSYTQPESGLGLRDQGGQVQCGGHFAMTLSFLEPQFPFGEIGIFSYESNKLTNLTKITLIWNNSDCSESMFSSVIFCNPPLVWTGPIQTTCTHAYIYTQTFQKSRGTQ